MSRLQLDLVPPLRCYANLAGCAMASRKNVGWVAYLCVIAFCAATVSCQTTTVFTSSWENQTSAIWPTLVRNWNCPCPSATFSFQSTAAARTGTYGVEVRVTTPSSEGWHVQLQSPVFNLSSTRVYTACFWLRTLIPGGADISMNLLARDGYQWVSGSNSRAATDWRRICIPAFAPPARTNGAATNVGYYYALDLGLPTGTMHIDDFTLESERNTAADDAAYCSDANVTARINLHRKGSFSFRFVNKTTNQALNSARLTSLKLRLVTHGFPFGCAMEWSGVPAARMAWYNNTARKHFNALVPEWSFKWPSYEPARGQFQDSLNYIMRNHIDFAARNDFVLSRGHTLEWPTKAWGFPQHWSRQGTCDQYRTYVRERITRDVAAFKGKFQSYDVFNEIAHELDFIERCPGMWPGILYDGFRWANQADPSAQLCLNDYELITGDKWREMVQLVTDMKAANVPIHCVGVQAYLSTQDLKSPVYMKPRLDALARLNVSILITEYNFWSYWSNNEPVWAGTEAEHAKMHEDYVRFWFSVPYIKGILMWGFWDSANWIRNGGIYYPNTTAKASATKLATLWGTTWNTTVSLTNVALSRAGVYGPLSGFYGKYWYEATLGRTTISGFLRFPETSGVAQTATVLI